MNNLSKKIEQQVLASFISDNTTNELYSHNLSLLNSLVEKDFEVQAHRHILKVFKYLDQNNYDLESTIIEAKLNKQAHQAYIQMITAPPVANIDTYIKMLKEATAKRELRLQAIKIINKSEEDVNLDATIEKIQNLQNIKSSTITKKFDISFLKNKTLTSVDIEKAEFDYLYDNLIVKAELTMIAAKPGSGKSLTTVAIANHALVNNKADTVIYFDLDNSTTTLKQRALNNLLDTHQEKFIYLHSSKNTKNEIFRYIKQFQNMDLTDKLFVFDSAKNFMMGGDRDKNKDVSKLTDIFKSLRDKGATVIFLHHTNKPSKDLDELIYSGSSAWEEDTTNAYILNKNEHKNSFIFKNFKARVGDMHDLAFTYNENHTLTPVDYDDAIETEEDEEIKDELISYLKENHMEPLKRAYTQVLMSIVKIGYPKNKVAAVMKINIDKRWSAIKQTQNNRTVYTVLNNPIITTFEDNMLDKCDKSDKSILSTLEELDNLGQVAISGDNSFIYNQSGTSINIDIPDIFKE